MANWRKLWNSVTEDETVDAMPDDFIRLTWVMLMLALDSEGRSIDRASLIRSKLYPIREDVTNERVQDALDWFANNGMIKRYTVSGRHYFYQVNHEKYQGTYRQRKEKPSSIPAPVVETEQEPIYEDIIPETFQNDSGSIPEVIRKDSVLDKSKIKIREEKSREESSAAATSGIIPEYGEIFTLFEQLDPRAQVTAIQSEDLKDLFDEYGGEKLIYAIHEASDHGAPTMAYIKGVLKGKAKPPGNGNHPNTHQGVPVSAGTRWV